MNLLKRLALIVSTLLLISACTSKKQKPALFSIDTRTLHGDTVITSVAYCNNRILCLQGNGKILALDTFLEKDPVTTAQFANTHVDFLQAQQDSVFIVTGNTTFYINGDFNLQPAKIEVDSTYGLPFYSDNNYNVYACSMGEWGGSVHFYRKQTQQHFVYPAKSVQQVFKFKGDYVVSNYLAHMSGYSDYLFIQEPLLLADITGKSVPCDLFHSLDIKKLEENAQGSVVEYSDTFTTHVLVTFPWHNDLYSIYATDSATILAKFQQQKLIRIDTLLPYAIKFGHTNTHLFYNGAITCYSRRMGVVENNGNTRNYQSTGLIFIKDSKIDFINFKLPNMLLE